MSPGPKWRTLAELRAYLARVRAWESKHDDRTVTALIHERVTPAPVSLVERFRASVRPGQQLHAVAQHGARPVKLKEPDQQPLARVELSPHLSREVRSRNAARAGAVDTSGDPLRTGRVELTASDGEDGVASGGNQPSRAEVDAEQNGALPGWQPSATGEVDRHGSPAPRTASEPSLRCSVGSRGELDARRPSRTLGSLGSNRALDAAPAQHHQQPHHHQESSHAAEETAVDGGRQW